MCGGQQALQPQCVLSLVLPEWRESGSCLRVAVAVAVIFNVTSGCSKFKHHNALWPRLMPGRINLSLYPSCSVPRRSAAHFAQIVRSFSTTAANPPQQCREQSACTLTTTTTCMLPLVATAHQQQPGSSGGIEQQQPSAVSAAAAAPSQLKADAGAVPQPCSAEQSGESTMTSRTCPPCP